MRQPAFDPFRYFIDMADNRVPFGNLGKTKTLGQPLPLTYGAKRIPPFEPFDYFTDMAGNFVPFTKLPRVKPRPHVVFIDDAVIFTNAGILQVTRLDIVNQHHRPRRSQWPPKQS